MKHFIYAVLFTVVAALTLSSCSNHDETNYTLLNLEKADLIYNGDEDDDINNNGAWKDVFSTANLSCQGISFSHYGTSDGYNYFSGFTASKSAVNSENAYIKDGIDTQWGCMAGSGVIGEGRPFIVAYWSEYDDKSAVSSIDRSCNIALQSGEKFKPEAITVCNNTYTYWTMKSGNSYTPAFTAGDYLNLVIVGALNNTITGKVTYSLADYTNSDKTKWTMNDTWDTVDLTPLGQVDHIYFTMESSQSNDFGILTPTYFCLDYLLISK